MLNQIFLIIYGLEYLADADAVCICQYFMTNIKVTNMNIYIYGQHWKTKLMLMQVNYIQFEGRDLEQSAWCSMPYNEEAKSFSKLAVILNVVTTRGSL